MKKVCFVTAARSEYGLLKWIMKDAMESPFFETRIIVTGSHLAKEQGYTVQTIKEDGFENLYLVDANLDVTDSYTIANYMGILAQKITEAFREIKPDYLVVLGDRYELLPICNSAFVLGIPIIHISGGDVTSGALDDGIRNAITMLSTYHFPGTKNAYENIIRMRSDKENVWVVGEPGLDNFIRETLMDRKMLAINLGLDYGKKWSLMTYHPETKQNVEYNLKGVRYCLEALVNKEELQTIVTYANADPGGKQINELIEIYRAQYGQKLIVVPSLGQARYLSLMREADLVIGNSSSGIVEAPMLGIPVINVGNRQNGRYLCKNVRQCLVDEKMIKKAIDDALNSDKIITSDGNYWGDGHAGERILRILLDKILKVKEK